MPSLAYNHRQMPAGNFHCGPNEVIAGRYKVIDEAGAGNFARVLRAHDMQKNNEIVAVKILRREYQRDAEFEHEILSAINKHDKSGEVQVCKMKAHFNWGGLPCFVFNLLGSSLKGTKHGPHTPMAELANFASQCCKTLSFLHFTCHMIHTDLKPENVLLDGPLPSGTVIGDSWSICDLGSASFFGMKADQDLIQTRPYRAPEVVMGCPWSYSVDMFSVGCIIYELMKGKKMFDAMNDEQHLIMFERKLGNLPSWLVRNGKPQVQKQYFDHHGRLIHSQSVYSNPYGSSSKKLEKLEDEFADQPELLDFLRQCLHYDPVLRLRADEACNHPWVLKYVNKTIPLITHLPTSPYGNEIKTPTTSLIASGKPLSKEQKEKLLAESIPSRGGSPTGFDRVNSEVMRSREQVVRQAAYALQPHMQPAAGMPSGTRGTLRGPTSRPTPPMPPPQGGTRYVTSSSAYGSNMRAPHVRNISSPNPALLRNSKMMTPPTY